MTQTFARRASIVVKRPAIFAHFVAFQARAATPCLTFLLGLEVVHVSFTASVNELLAFVVVTVEVPPWHVRVAVSGDFRQLAHIYE